MSYKCLINLEGFFILWHNVESINIPCGTILLLIWWTFTRELTFLKKKTNYETHSFFIVHKTNPWNHIPTNRSKLTIHSICPPRTKMIPQRDELLGFNSMTAQIQTRIVRLEINSQTWIKKHYKALITFKIKWRSRMLDAIYWKQFKVAADLHVAFKKIRAFMSQNYSSSHLKYLQLTV